MLKKVLELKYRVTKLNKIASINSKTTKLSNMSVSTVQRRLSYNKNLE